LSHGGNRPGANFRSFNLHRKRKNAITLTLTLLLTLTLNPQSTKLESEINWISYYTITITMYEM